MTLRRKALALVIGITAAAVLADRLVLRSRYLRWGATDDERQRQWPGDELTPHPGHCTRAVTVHAPAEEVWPWILQIGQDRGGFYSYTWLENLLLAEMRNAETIVPEYQSRQVGDIVWMAPEHRYGKRASMSVAQLIPHRAMVLVQRHQFEASQRGEQVSGGIWQFLLDPIDGNSTRLIVRGAAPERTGLLYDLIFDPGHFIMERKMLLGIKERAEGARRTTF